MADFNHLLSISSWYCQVERWAQVSCEPGWGAVAEPIPKLQPVILMLTWCLSCSALCVFMESVSCILQYVEMQSLALEAVWGPVEFGWIQSGLNPALWDAHLFSVFPGCDGSLSGWAKSLWAPASGMGSFQWQGKITKGLFLRRRMAVSQSAEALEKPSCEPESKI